MLATRTTTARSKGLNMSIYTNSTANALGDVLGRLVTPRGRKVWQAATTTVRCRL